MPTYAELESAYREAKRRAAAGDKVAEADARLFSRDLIAARGGDPDQPFEFEAPAQPERRPETFEEFQAQQRRRREAGGTFADTLAQGLTLGFSDELAGLAGGAVGALRGESFSEVYRGIRDAARQRAAAFAERNPEFALGTELLGGLATGGLGLARAGGRRLAASALGGGAYGAGASEAETLPGVLRDAALGAGVGLATGGAATVNPSIAQPLIGAAASRALQRNLPGGPAVGQLADRALGGASRLADLAELPVRAAQGAVGTAAVPAGGLLSERISDVVSPQPPLPPADPSIGLLQ